MADSDEICATEYISQMQPLLDAAAQTPDEISWEKEFAMQQGIYTNLSGSYDDSNLNVFDYKGHILTAEHTARLYPNNKNVKILDFGAGTGLAGVELKKRGFQNIYAIDINRSMLEQAQQKNCYTGLYLSKSGDVDSLDFIFDNTFDVVVSAGVFYCTKSHAGTEYFEKFCNIVKPGGMIILVMAEIYTQASYIKWEEIERLEKLGRLRAHPVITGEYYKKNHKGNVYVYDVLQ